MIPRFYKLKYLKASITAFVFVMTVSFIQPQHPTGSALVEIKKDSSFIFIGNFTDDYGIKYTINDSVWKQHPNTKYQIIHWDKRERFIIARNMENNPSDAGLYCRIDYMEFKNMQPYTWGFCYTIFNAKTEALALQTIAADSGNPKKGCNGFPFSRMKRNN